jgi:hypothetical protein
MNLVPQQGPTSIRRPTEQNFVPGRPGARDLCNSAEKNERTLSRRLLNLIYKEGM